jgi:hypothetical protein
VRARFSGKKRPVRSSFEFSSKVKMLTFECFQADVLAATTALAEDVVGNPAFLKTSSAERPKVRESEICR